MAALLSATSASCASSADPRVSEVAPASAPCPVPAPPAPPPVEPGPACADSDAPGPWPRAASMPRVAGAHLEQTLADGRTVRLRFLGAHLFDLLDKLAHEARPDELDRRRVACAALEAAASSGAPVVRLWGSLKRTGTSGEVDRAAEMLALVLDENARRKRPLRFVITLLNHQGGYGAPHPERSLDDQDPTSPWSARRLYVSGGWRAPGQGLLLERIERLRERPDIARSPYVLAWELVNELDTHRAIAGGSFRGPEADALVKEFAVPALGALAASFPQPLMLGDLRGDAAAYPGFARALVAKLPPDVRARFVWTSHVYAPLGAAPADLARATKKLDLDLAIAAEHHLPFLLGELGQHARGEVAFCGSGPAHDPAALFAAVLEPRPAIDAAIFWGEGRCDLALPSPAGARRISVGVGGDTADLAPGDERAREAVRAARASARFRAD
jgi:hypothetical protein